MELDGSTVTLQSAAVSQSIWNYLWLWNSEISRLPGTLLSEMQTSQMSKAHNGSFIFKLSVSATTVPSDCWTFSPNVYSTAVSWGKPAFVPLSEWRLQRVHKKHHLLDFYKLFLKTKKEKVKLKHKCKHGHFLLLQLVLCISGQNTLYLS